MLWPRRLMNSLYGRTILQLATAILIVFSLMGVVYYGIVTTASARQQSSQLLASARAIAEIAGPAFNSNQGQITNSTVISYLNFTARSTGALVWVIDSNGTLAYTTSVPASISAQFESSDGAWIVPESYRGGSTLGKSGLASIGDFRGLFRSTGQRWISHRRPDSLTDRCLYG